MENIDNTEVEIVEGVTPLAVPAPSFWASQAMSEFGVAMPGWFSNAMRAGGAALPGNMSQMAGKSAFTKTNTMTVGVSANNNQWGWNSVSVFGALSPTTAAGLSFSYMYYSGGRFQASLSAVAADTATYRISFTNGLTNTFTTSAGKSFLTFVTDTAFNTAVGTYIQGSVGKNIDIAIVRL